MDYEVTFLYFYVGFIRSRLSFDTGVFNCFILWLLTGIILPLHIGESSS